MLAAVIGGRLVSLKQQVKLREVLLSPNGADKPSVSVLLIGLETPNAGGMTPDCTALDHLPPNRRARQVEFLPQCPDCGRAFTVCQTAAPGRLS